MSELTRQSQREEAEERVRAAAEGYAVDFLDELARAAAAEQVLDFQWGIAVGRALVRGWRVLPPSLTVAADTVLEEDLDRLEEALTHAR